MDIMKVKDCMCNDVKFVTPNTIIDDFIEVKVMIMLLDV